MDLKNIKIEDPFWGHMQELVTDVVIPFQEDVLNDRQIGRASCRERVSSPV